MEGARSPEELATLLEDACLLQDAEALPHLFEDGAVLVPDPGAPEARGLDEIAATLTWMWERNGMYLAGAARVIQAGPLALALTDTTVHVLRRGEDRAWRYVISFAATSAARH